MKWEEVSSIDRNDLLYELEEMAKEAEETANNSVYGPSESYSWQQYSLAIKAAIEKLKES